MKANTKAIVLSVVASLVIVGVLVVWGNHQPLPYDPADKMGILNNFLYLLLN